MRRFLILVLILSMTACSSEREKTKLTAATYTLDISKTGQVDTTLVDRFNESVYSDVPRITSISSVTILPEHFPELFLLAPQFERTGKPRPESVCYDTEQERFFLIWRKYFERDFNEMVVGRFKSVDAERAFGIASLAVMLRYRPRMIVTRPADLYLEQYLRPYINATYTPDSTNWGTVMSNIWWAWEAFPEANNEYRKFFSAYEDSLNKADFLRDLPDDVIGEPQVNKRGIYWEVSLYGLPSSRELEILRYRLRIADNGRLHEISEEPVYYY